MIFVFSKTLLAKYFQINMLLGASPYDDFSHFYVTIWCWNAFTFFLLLAYYFMMSECSYTWCVVSVLVTSLCCMCFSIYTCSVLRYDQSFCVILCCLFEYPCDWTMGLTQTFYLKI